MVTMMVAMVIWVVARVVAMVTMMVVMVIWVVAMVTMVVTMVIMVFAIDVHCDGKPKA